MKTHGMEGTPTYKAWANMKHRCSKPTHRQFAHYGGRGITVCDRWMSFENFLFDMGIRPTGRTIERKNNNEGYSPENCCWATRKEQARNRRTTNRLTFQGVTKSLTEWAEQIHISRITLRKRLERGLSLTEALTIPLDLSKSHR